MRRGAPAAAACFSTFSCAGAQARTCDLWIKGGMRLALLHVVVEGGVE
jgi:hypothetical protein